MNPTLETKKRLRLRLPDWTRWLCLPLAFLAYLGLDTSLRYLFDGVGIVPAASAPPWIFSMRDIGAIPLRKPFSSAVRRNSLSFFF